MSLPSQSEEPLNRSHTLYLGTSVFNKNAKDFDESKLTLDLLQTTIAERFPTNGSSYSKGIETWLSIFPNGMQMEHSSASDTPTISALFYYPIRSLVYCGALRCVFENVSDRMLKKNSSFSSTNKISWKFVPLDAEIAQSKENVNNPPLFVALLKGIDSLSKKEIIETCVFVVSSRESAMGLVEACQKAYNGSNVSTNDFYKKYGNIPVVFCLKDDLTKRKDKRVVVKNFDLNGYFYATENTEIDTWQLFESPDDKDASFLSQPDDVYADLLKDELKASQTFINPYEKSDNLLGVDKHVDPATGQTIYVRYLTENVNDKSDLIYGHKDDLKSSLYSKKKQPPIIIREKTPSPIIYERYIKSKAPQVIIKEIHIQDPAPEPIKVVQKLDQFKETKLSYETQDLVKKTPKKVIEKIATKTSKSNQKLNVKSDKEQQQPAKPSIYSIPKALHKRKESKEKESSSAKPSQPPTPPLHHEPIYSGVEHIPPHSNNFPSQQPAQQQQQQIQYKEYNPYSTYYNYNGYPTLRSNYNMDQSSYRHRNQYNNYGSLEKNMYGPRYMSAYPQYGQNPYAEHANYQAIQGYPSYPADFKNSYNYSRKPVRSDTYNNPYSNGKYQPHYRDEAKSVEKGKKIYYVDENELEHLKQKLSVTRSNKKIVVIDESEIERIEKKPLRSKRNEYEQTGMMYNNNIQDPRMKYGREKSLPNRMYE